MDLNLNFMMEQEKELTLLVTGDEGLLMKMRTENKFDEQMFNRVVELLEYYFTENQECDSISKVIVYNCIYLVDALAGGSRFFDDETAEMVEDASNMLTSFFDRIAPI